MKNKIFSVFLMSLLLLSSSCVDLEAIRQFTDNAATVEQKFPELSADFYRSCTQIYKYQFYRLVKFDARKEELIDQVSETKNLDGYISNVPRGPDGFSIIQRELKCREWKKNDQAASLLNKALVEYIKALGALAADDLTVYDNSLGALGKSITATGIFEAKHIEAGTSLANLVLNASTDFWRRKKIKSAIEERDKDVSTLSEVLKKYIAVMYVEQLNNEKSELGFYYKNTISDYQAQNGTANQLEVIKAEKDWASERKELDKKIDSANAYGKILDNVIEGHHKLYEFRESLNSKEVKQKILGYARNIEGLIPIFKKTFN